MRPDEDTMKQLAWLSVRTPEQVMKTRERVVSAIERRAAELVANGEQNRWLATMDEGSTWVAATVNGPLAP